MKRTRLFALAELEPNEKLCNPIQRVRLAQLCISISTTTTHISYNNSVKWKPFVAAVCTCVCVFGGLFFIYIIFSSDFSYNLDEIHYNVYQNVFRKQKVFLFLRQRSIKSR